MVGVVAAVATAVGDSSPLCRGEVACDTETFAYSITCRSCRCMDLVSNLRNINTASCRTSSGMDNTASSTPISSVDGDSRDNKAFMKVVAPASQCCRYCSVRAAKGSSKVVVFDPDVVDVAPFNNDSFVANCWVK